MTRRRILITSAAAACAVTSACDQDVSLVRNCRDSDAQIVKYEGRYWYRDRRLAPLQAIEPGTPLDSICREER